MEIKGLVYANNGGEVDLYIDNNGSTRLLLDTIAEYKLFQGKLITEELFQEIKEFDIISRLFKKSLNYISIRPRTEFEEIQYLNKQNLNIEKEKKEIIIEKVLSRLREGKYLNDKEFCKWLIGNRIDLSLKSRMEVKAELMQKGVNSKIIENSINEIYSEASEQEVFNKVFEKKYGNFKNFDEKQRQKVYNYFQRRGFNYHLIKNKFDI